MCDSLHDSLGFLMIISVEVTKIKYIDRYTNTHTFIYICIYTFTDN